MHNTKDWDPLHSLLFTARRVVEGVYVGGHVSSRLGVGVDFHDYRPYVPGDDLSRVDWKLYGRTDRHYLKRHVHHTDLNAYLLLDASASMRFVGLGPADNGRSGQRSWFRGDRDRAVIRVSKWVYAQTLAAAIAFLVVRQSDRVGVGVFDQALRLHVPPGGGMAHLHRIVHAIEDACPGQTPTPADVGAALHATRDLIKRRGTVVVIGDFLDEPAGLLDGLDRLRHDRFNAMVLQVLSPQERRLETLPAARFELVDSETRDRVSTHVPTIARRYDRLMDQHIDSLRRGCAARGMDFHSITTDEPVSAALRRVLVDR